MKKLDNKFIKLTFTFIIAILTSMILCINLNNTEAYVAGQTVYVGGYEEAYGASIVGIKKPSSGNGSFYCIEKGNTTEANSYRISEYTGYNNEYEHRKLQAIVGYGGNTNWTFAKQLAVWMGHKGLTYSSAASGYFSNVNIPAYKDVKDIIDKATEYAEKSTNAQVPKINKENNCSAVHISNNTYKIGPFTLDYDAKGIYKITSIKAYGNSGEVSISEYQDENGRKISGIPASGKKFYLVVPNINISTTQKIVNVSIKYSYTDYSKIKIFEAKRGVAQRLILVEGNPEAGEQNVDLKVDIPLIKPGSYSLELLKTDSNNSEIKLKDVEFEVSRKVGSGEKKSLGKYKTNGNGLLTIPQIEITSETTQIITIKEAGTPQYYEDLNVEIELKVEVEQVDEVVNGVKTGAKTFAVKNITITKNTSSDNGACTAQLVKDNNSSKYKISLNIPNKRKKIKLSGYVWEDKQLSKELLVNGIKDEGEEFVPDIQVTLHTRNNENILYTDSSTMQTKTNQDGYYEFEIPMGPEYYVEFTYNGQNYQHTKYTTWTGNGNPLTSNSTEGEIARDNLNKPLETITPNMTVNGTKIDNTINDKGPTYIDEACYRISAYTGAYGNEKDIKYYSTTSKNINLGITKREEADIAVRKDLYKAVSTIKGYTQEYVYNRRNLTTDENGDKYWDISARASDAYYGNGYTRSINSSDYNYKNNEENATDKLTINVTYVIAIRNQSGALDTYIRSLAEYYDQDYEYIDAYIGDKDGNKISDVKVSDETNAPFGEYKQRTITGLDGAAIKPGADMYIYITFSVGTGTNIKLDDDAGKGNMIEITSYSTYYGEGVKSPNDGNSSTYTEYKSGDIAGRVDVDSNPGNATSIKEETFEDDTDRAPYVKFKISENNERTIEGAVWEDSRTETVENAVVGNGIKDEKETLIDGITVELWDKDANSIAKLWDGSNWVDATATTHDGGQYSFSSFVPGNYYVKFTYGGSKYNGQDYKSTKYRAEVNNGFDYNNPDVLGTYIETETRYSDARDIYGDAGTERTRAYVNNLYAGEMTQPRESKLNANDMYMQAVTGLMNVYIEKGGNNIPNLSGVDTLAYSLGYVDFGLQERPKAQLMLTKEVSNVKVTLANGSVLFDTTGKGTNVIWQNQTPHVENPYQDNGKLIKNELNPRKIQRQIVLTMDEELMHGATIQITYKIKVDNIGEVDYGSKQFYYRGEKASDDAAVTTRVNKIIDYAGAAGTDTPNASRNNLKFDSSANSPEWKQYTLDEIYNYENSKTSDKGLISRNLLNKENENYIGSASKYSTILVREFNKELTPRCESEAGSSVETTLVLSQVMSADNTSDDRIYNNMAEVVSLENGVGRRMTYTTVGDQDPEAAIAQIDADGQGVTILPPFGQSYIYYILGAGIAIIAIAGIIIIKKRVLKSKNK